MLCAPEEMKDKSILIIDDQPETIEQVALFLEENGIMRFYQATDGTMGIEVACRKRPDLIITDWEMPGLSGIETIQKLKALTETCDIPVIMCTGIMTTSENLELALNAGAVDFVRKPVDPIELAARVRSTLLLSETYSKLQNGRAELEVLNESLRERNVELELAIDHVKTLRGLLPICSHCKKIRDDSGYWRQIEVYISQHSEAGFSHGICPDCLDHHYSEYQCGLDPKS